MQGTFQSLKIPISINSSDHDITKDFFTPLLQCSVNYKRGVGYFSSGWLKINSIGLIDFINNGGIAYWITSPILSEEDWKFLKKGNEAKQDVFLKNKLKENIISLKDTLEKETLSALAWMVADNVLHFKLAVPRGKLDGDFHDKFGIFSDADGNKVTFSGSYNESIKGTRNYESFKIFKSWETAHEGWVNEDIVRFEKLWNNLDSNVRVFDIDEANKQEIKQLRFLGRPYKKKSPNVEESENEYNVIKLRDYQINAIHKWFENGCRGFYEMATGTGKTITALATAQKLYKQEGKLALIIVVPYQHLVDQWQNDARLFGFKSILAYKSSKLWVDKLNQQIIDFNNGFRNELSVITTKSTFVTELFQKSISRLNGSSLFVADEAHHLGSLTLQKSYPHNISKRLALSATPNRWFDDYGTKALRKFFGETVFEFPLKDAIGVSLTPYYYHPHLVELTQSEIDEYKRLTDKIVKLVNNKKGYSEDRVKSILLERSDLLNNATNKIRVLSDLVDEYPVEKHTLVYCAPGQIDRANDLLGNNKGLITHPFTSKENNKKRIQLLKDFENGNIQVLTAIRCLDEGVDVPSTRTAFLLASSSNPREFIQRRGRVLRKAPGKDYSVIHDLITIPPSVFDLDKNSTIFKLERNILKRELNRFKEFADHARNKHEAIDKVWQVARRYQLMDF